MIELKTSPTSQRPLDDKIIPMINVIFLLLLFFLIAGNMSDLVREDLLPPRSDSVTISTTEGEEWLLDIEGMITVQGRRLEHRQLSEWLNQSGTQLPRRLTLRADARVQSAELLTLMQWLRERGVNQVALTTLSNQPPA